MVNTFSCKKRENGRKNIFKDKQTTKKVHLMFLGVKMLTKSWKLRFSTLSTNKKGTMYVFSV